MVPIGGIIEWAGAIIDIDPNYRLCDGSNGTPDLRDAFIVGAGATYAVGAVGGNETHSHDVNLGSHNHSVNEVDGAITGPGTDIWHAGNDGNVTDDEPIAGTTDMGSSLPPFYALAKIQRFQ